MLATATRRWGDPGLPWLPAVVRVALADVRVDDVLREYLGEVGVVYGSDLDSLFWQRATADTAMCRWLMATVVQRQWARVWSCQVHTHDVTHTLADLVNDRGLEAAIEHIVHLDLGIVPRESSDSYPTDLGHDLPSVDPVASTSLSGSTVAPAAKTRDIASDASMITYTNDADMIAITVRRQAAGHSLAPSAASAPPAFVPVGPTAAEAQATAVTEPSTADDGLRSELRRLALRCGAAPLALLREQLGGMDRHQLNELIAQLGAVIVVDDWALVATTKRNRIEIMLRKMFSVSSALSFDDLVEGVERGYRLHQITPVPPPSVLRTWVEIANWLQVQASGVVVAYQQCDPWVELDGGDAVAMTVLSAAPAGLLTRGDLVEQLIAGGLNFGGANNVVSSSPIIKRVSSGVYGLRGRNHDSGRIHELSEALVREGVAALPPRVTFDGAKLQVARRVDRGALESGILPIPKAARRELPDSEYSLVVGATVVDQIQLSSGGNSWGWTKALVHARAYDGCVALLRFDITNRIAELRIGSIQDLHD